MKIIPYKNKIQVEMLTLKSALQTEIKVEKAKVIAIGDEVNTSKHAIGKITSEIKVGDMLYVKAWAIDIIQDGGKDYNFVSADNDAICAIIR